MKAPVVHTALPKLHVGDGYRRQLAILDEAGNVLADLEVKSRPILESIVRAVNAHAELVEALETIRNMTHGVGEADGEEQAIADIAIKALAKALRRCRVSVAAMLHNVKAAAAKFGASVEEDVGAYQAVAPDGFHWVESDSCHICMPYGHDDRAASRIAALRDGLPRIQAGTRPMTDQERYEAGED